MIVLAVLRHDQRLADVADVADGNNVSESTVRRRRDELIALLVAQAPRLDRALRKVAKRGGEVVLIDGTLIPTERRTGRANRRNYSGKHHRHGLHLLQLTPCQKTADHVLAVGRTPVEHGFAHLKNWRILTSAAPTRPAPPVSCAPCLS
ncbi:hypothetical protein [Streptomyces nondiastaticus]|uniref:Transposase n=1 Tax=Streptomyces nondiastaticus TaxID=3154512 RepID=A0ABW6U464_9ACTN